MAEGGGAVTTLALWFLMNASLVADWGQTRYIASHPQQYREAVNPILGEHPSIHRVDAWFLGSLAVNNGIMLALPKKYRPYYAGTVTAVETYFVVSNNRIGIKIDF
jgi:hypothetical protein